MTIGVFTLSLGETIMSKKHFVAIAEDFQSLLAETKTKGERLILERTASLLAYTFAECNGQFDRHRFLSACGF